MNRVGFSNSIIAHATGLSRPTFLDLQSQSPMSKSVTLQPSGASTVNAFAKSGDRHVYAHSVRSAGASHRFSPTALRRYAGGKRGLPLVPLRRSGLESARQTPTAALLPSCPRFPHRVSFTWLKCYKLGSSPISGGMPLKPRGRARGNVPLQVGIWGRTNIPVCPRQAYERPRPRYWEMNLKLVPLLAVSRPS